MTKIKILILLLMSNIAFANIDTKLVNSKYQLHANGEKMFSAIWTPYSGFGLINLVIVVQNYDNELSQGIALSAAKTFKIISPELPKDCELGRFYGEIRHPDSWGSSISFTVEGKSCGPFMQQLETEALEFELTKVPYEDDSGMIPKMNLKIIDLP